jgi:archaellum component FlaG (FlaF/FlaG flagellin family)
MKKYIMHTKTKTLPPKGAENWTLVSPEQPEKIKRIVQFSVDPYTKTIYISNLGSTMLKIDLNEDTVMLFPVEKFGSYVTSTDLGRKIWSNLIDAGYKPV